MQVKAEWAFRVFDFDGDGKLNKDDIYKTVSALTDQTEQGEGPESKAKLETEKVFGKLCNYPPPTDLFYRWKL